MHRPLLVLWAFSLALLTGCGQTDVDSTSPSTTVALAAAFVNLDHVDVYDDAGNALDTLDASSNFTRELGFGHYLMDFVDENGNHSFMNDGRLAFAPMGDGILPEDGPINVDGVDSPLWDVEVNPVLEANARFIDRLSDGEETLRPWKDISAQNWQRNLPLEARDVQDDGWAANDKSYSTGSSTAARAFVTWYASYAMKGSSSSACNTATACFGSESTSGTYGIGPGFLQAYSTYWGTGAMSVGTTSGNASCRDNPTASGYCSSWSGTTCVAYYGCGVSVGSANGSYSTNWSTRYACQSTSVSASSPCYGPIYAHGGECKFFQNFLLYTSGQYMAGAGIWKNLPSDGTISAYSTTGADAPTATIGNIAVGDPLRRLSSVHSMLVVAYDSTAQTAMVVDSNYLGSTSTFNEYIGARQVGFSSSSYSGYNQLGNYRALKCVYTGGC